MIRGYRHLNHHKHYPFKIEHLEYLDLVDDEKALVFDQSDFLALMAQSQNNRAYCGVACDSDDAPLFVGGWYETTPGVCQLFIILDKSIYRRRKAFVRAVLYWLNLIKETGWCHRIQTTSLPIERIDRFMEATGFIYEGVLRRYTEAGQDYKLWSTVKVNGIWES